MREAGYSLDHQTCKPVDFIKRSATGDLCVSVFLEFYRRPCKYLNPVMG